VVRVVAVRFLPALAAFGVVLLMALTTDLGSVARTIAIGCVVASFLGAVVFRRPYVGAHASVVAGVAAVMAAGQTRGGVAFGVAAAGFFAASLVTLRLARRAGAVRLPVRPLAVIVGATVASLAASVVFLPPLVQRVQATIMATMNVDSPQATAFTTQMTLGATTGMLQSGAIVARVEGDHPDYLRGAVYDDYDGARWTTTPPGRATKVVRANVAAAARVTMTLDRNAPEGVDMRWFLPPGACGFDQDIEVDGFGVGRRARGEPPRHLSFALSGCTPAPVLPPSNTDRNGMLTALRRSLAPIAASWTAGATTDREKLKAIREHLLRYEYSLAVERSESLDPIFDFLTVHKAGHCEFFASAMALLARTQGIPARVIGGYRVDEINPLTNQSVVRDRNAHAWVEAWLDGGWHPYDPTPVADGPGSFFAHASDLWEMLKDRVVALGLLGFAVVLTSILAAMFALRALRNWVRAPQRRRAWVAMEHPLPCFEELSAKLAAAGFHRDASEPIEAFAERVPIEEAASALVAYAALRYGGVGSEKSVAAAAEKALRAIGSWS
jgi:transglutaminase-like putative cysteine protease